MHRMLITAVAVVVLVGCSETRPQADQHPRRVGEVRIIGNVVTSDRFILERVCEYTYPGKRLSAADMLKAEWALTLAGLDALVMARESPYDVDSPYWNLEVYVRETPVTYLAFGRRRRQ